MLEKAITTDWVVKHHTNKAKPKHETTEIDGEEKQLYTETKDSVKP